MPGGKRNPISLTGLVQQLEDVVNKAKRNSHDMAKTTKDRAKLKFLNVPYVDVQIQFIGATGLPRMDVVGSADPYFVAKLEDNISFVSTVKPDTATPVWNEMWRIRNVPSTADLSVEVMDKDEGGPHDDFIGAFKTSVTAGAKQLELEGPLLRRKRGTFWLKIETIPSSDPEHKSRPFLFDGPIRYSRHHSPTLGILTNLDQARLYSTWKMYLKGIPLCFADNEAQHWNTKYKAAQSIFQGPTSIAVRSGIQAGHRMLYARTSDNGFGVIETPEDVLAILQGGDGTGTGTGLKANSKANTNENGSGLTNNNNNNNNDGGDGLTSLSTSSKSNASPFIHRIKPAVYTYILSAEDDSFRFSETGAAFFVDFASKHALHSNCAQYVRYSGEFHPRPKGGWNHFNDSIPDDKVDWELVIDNNSGTYSPDPALLPKLKALLEYNFPGFGIFALSYEDPGLVESREACRAYALKYRGIRQEELQPHVRQAITGEEPEETLSKRVSRFAQNVGKKMPGGEKTTSAVETA